MLPTTSWGNQVFDNEAKQIAYSLYNINKKNHNAKRKGNTSGKAIVTHGAAVTHLE